MCRRVHSCECIGPVTLVDTQKRDVCGCIGLVTSVNTMQECGGCVNVWDIDICECTGALECV